MMPSWPPARIWVFTKRQTLWAANAQRTKNGGAMCFAWFVWERGYDGPPEVKRLDVGWLNE